MTATHDETASQQVEHKPPRILRYEEYLNAQKAPADAATPERARRDLEAAQRRYQETIRAFPPEYYGVGRHARYAASAATIGAAGAQMAAVGLAGDAPRPEADGEPELTDHNYDGIQEYDNPTPGWWYALFAACVVFSIGYVFVFHVSGLVPSLPERHAAAEARALDRQFADLNGLPMGEDKVLAIMSEASWLDRGKAIFAGSCAVCHAADGSGTIGPNLTDENYRNIAGLMDIAELVKEGTPNGSMPAQKNLLNDNEVALVTAYAASLRGRNLPTGPTVDPDYLGKPIAPWPAPTPASEGSFANGVEPDSTQASAAGAAAAGDAQQ